MRCRARAGEAEAVERIGAMLEKRERAADHIVRGDAVADVDHLVEPPGADRRRAELQSSAPGKASMLQTLVVPQRRSSAKPRCDRREIIVAVEAALERIDALDPGGETLRRRDRVPHHRVVEMAVRVDQPRQQRRLRRDRSPVRPPSPAHDPAARPTGDDVDCPPRRPRRFRSAVRAIVTTCARANDHAGCHPLSSPLARLGDEEIAGFVAEQRQRGSRRRRM